MKHNIQYYLIFFVLLLGMAKPSSIYSAEKLTEQTAQLQSVHNTYVKNDKDTRIKKLSSILSRYNSPMNTSADTFIEIADKYNLDWKLVAAISGVESGFGNHIPYGSYNAWGWGIFTGESSGITFNNWDEGIEEVSRGIKTGYIDRGAITLDQIGNIYAASPTWSTKVRHFMNQINNSSIHQPQFIELTI